MQKHSYQEIGLFLEFATERVMFSQYVLVLGHFGQNNKIAQNDNSYSCLINNNLQKISEQLMYSWTQ